MVTHAGARLDPECWRGLPVLLTGHTGFKGGWLSLWLRELGAEVHGYALAPEPGPQLFELADVGAALAAHHEADIVDEARLAAVMQATRPRLVVHLAAQSLVRRSYDQPVRTWASNVMGTAHLLEAARHCDSVRAVVVISSDKCYENLEQPRAYRETDPLGGHDPYSASKAATELVVQSWRRSFGGGDGKTWPLIASARAGNVIGGGDFSLDRLIPDAARASRAGAALTIRRPASTRPWQHVLEALHGYLLLAQGLLGEAEAGATPTLAEPFNFGPADADNLSVAELLTRLGRHWPELRWQVEPDPAAPHEAGLLHLDAGKAAARLGWRPRWPLDGATDGALARTAAWYRAWSASADLAALTRAQLRDFAA